MLSINTLNHGGIDTGESGNHKCVARISKIHNEGTTVYIEIPVIEICHRLE